MKQLESMILKNQITDGPTIAAYYKYKLFLQNHENFK